MPLSTKFIRKLDKLQPDLKAVLLDLIAEIEKQRGESISQQQFQKFAQATQENFQNVWKAIGELTKAQQRTEKRVEELAEAQQLTEKRVAELAEAQRRTEKRVEELAEAQEQTEKRLEALTQRVHALTVNVEALTKHVDALTVNVEALTKRVDALTVNVEALTKRVDALTVNVEALTKRVDALTVNVDSLTKRMDQLADAQIRTEQTIAKLARQVEENTKQLGGISNTIGYGLEDKSFPLLRKALKEQFNIEVDELYRTNLRYSQDRWDEINIYGEGRRNGDIIYVIGESKAQFGPRDVRSFLKLIERVKDHLKAPVFSLALSYHYHPNAEDELKEAGIPYFWSFQLNKYAS